MTTEPLPPTIPEKLAAAGYRFIKILPGSKFPIEKDYQKTKNYLATDREIINWISYYKNFELKSKTEKGKFVHFEGCGNYAVLCTSELVVLDLDRQDIIDHALSHPILKDALAAQSGSGEGRHIFIRTKGARTVVFDDKKTNTNIGHIKAGPSGYAVGPSCYHPSGGIYKFLNNGEIPTIPFQDLLDHFSEFIKKLPSPVEVEPARNRYYSDSNEIDIPVEQILTPLKIQRNGNEIKGIHPIHGAKNLGNLSINTQTNKWFCHRCKSGGTAPHAIAVAHGLVDCSDAHKGMFKGNRDLYEQVLRIAEERYGWVPKVKPHPKKPHILEQPHEDEQFDFGFEFPKTIEEGKKSEIIYTEELPQDLPESEITLIDGYPRIGKTHWSEIQAIKHRTANVIANTHSVIEQHLRIFKENREPGQTAVHLEGRDRCCKIKSGGQSCKGCEYYPYSSDPSDRGKFLAFVGETLSDKGILTASVVPDTTCPYFFLKEAARIADYVFTVPENLEEITGDSHQKRHLTIIDEDTCCASFFPQSVDLAEFSRGLSKTFVHSVLETKWVGIQRWKDYILKGKRPKGKETILKIIEILENFRDVLRIKDDEVFSTGAIYALLEEVDVTVPEPIDITKQELIKNIQRWEIKDTLSPYAIALLFPYKERFLDWQGYNPMKLRMIADEQERICDPPDTKLIIIGSTRAEMLIRGLGRTWTVIRINKFQYSKNFVFVLVGKGKDKRRKSYKKNLVTALATSAKTNSDYRYPLLVLTGSKKEQQTVIEELGGICKGSSDENIFGQRWNYVSGCFNVFYQNSVISRGVDIPFYKSIALYSSDFASPYWTARRSVAEATKNREDFDYAQEVIDAISIDETTNSVLRITPVIKHEDTTPRIVILSEYDEWKIKRGVLESATIIQTTPEGLAENMETILDITGRMEIQDEEHDFMPDMREITFWKVHAIKNEPLEIRGKTLEEKKGYIEGIFSGTNNSYNEWKTRISPKILLEVEKSLVGLLVSRQKEGRSVSISSATQWLNGRDRRGKLEKVDLQKAIANLITANKIRSNESKISKSSTIYLPTQTQEEHGLTGKPTE